MPSEPRTILLAEDDADLRDVLGEVLGAEGFQLIMAEDGRTALSASAELSLFAALVDKHLPGLTGDHVAAELLRRDPGLRVVLMSGDQNVSGPPGVALLQKPFPIDVLLRRLRGPAEA